MKGTKNGFKITLTHDERNLLRPLLGQFKGNRLETAAVSDDYENFAITDAEWEASELTLRFPTDDGVGKVEAYKPDKHGSLEDLQGYPIVKFTKKNIKDVEFGLRSETHVFLKKKFKEMDSKSEVTVGGQKMFNTLWEKLEVEK